jgi:hypothetical protein
MTLHTPIETEVELVTGEYLDLRNPDPERISLYAIAHALGNTCRYGGNCKEYFSVAEHAVLVSTKLRALGADLRLQLAGLHHDDAEFVLCDIQRPLKPLLGDEYKEVSRRMDYAIWVALNMNGSYGTFIRCADNWEVSEYEDPLLKKVDRWACLLEAAAIMPSKGAAWDNVWWQTGEEPIPTEDHDAIVCYSPAAARDIYISLHEALVVESRGAP